MPICVLLIDRTPLSHFVLKFAPSPLALTPRSSAALAFPRRKFTAGAGSITSESNDAAAPPYTLKRWLFVNSVGVGIFLSAGAAAVSGVYAGVIAYTTKEAADKAEANAKAAAETAKATAEKTQTSLETFKKEQEAAVKELLADKEKVLRAQADSVEKSLRAQGDSVEKSLRAQADSVKTQAWGAYISTNASSGVAFVISGAALAVALRK